MATRAALACALLRAPTWRGALPSSSLLRASVASTPTSVSRGLAKKADKKKGAVFEVPIMVAENKEDMVRGLNMFKDSSDEVKVKPDSEYPDWVFTLHMPRASLEELSAKYKEDPMSLSEWDTKRMIKLWNRRRIREGNEAKQKK